MGVVCLRPDVGESLLVTTMTDDLCHVCGLPIQVGEYPCIFTPRAHGKSVQTTPFSTYFDYGLGKEITSLGDRWNAMKENHLDYRDKMSPGDLSARKDRIEQRKREQARG